MRSAIAECSGMWLATSSGVACDSTPLPIPVGVSAGISGRRSHPW
jgi:hypothetical protein